MAPLAQIQPTRAELVRNFELLIERTSTPAEAAALRGMSVDTVRRMIRRGELDQVLVGRDLRVWRDDA